MYVVHTCTSMCYFIVISIMIGVSLESILSFFSGGESVPPMGFETQPVLYFSSSAVLPTASTCAITLTLPTCYHNQSENFKIKMTFAIMNHGGFGTF